MDITFSEYHDLVSRIEVLERSSLGDYAIFIPLCILALVLVVFTIMFVAICIDQKKNK